MKRSVINCPLCQAQRIGDYSQDKFRSYLECESCQLVFVPRDQLIEPTAEKDRYDTHNNDENDPGYQKYLSQIVNLIVPELSPKQTGLDFGCGRTKLMAHLFEAASFHMDAYDIFYHPDENIWKKKYDFIVLSEVIEHLREPMLTMEELTRLLLPHGKIFIKTRLLPMEKAAFTNWYYKNDPTHVQFFNLVSLKKLAEQLKLQGPQVLSEDLFALKA